MTGRDPARGLGRTGLVLAVLLPPAGMAVSFVARARSRSAGFVNRSAVWGLGIGAVLIVVDLMLLVTLAGFGG